MVEKLVTSHPKAGRPQKGTQPQNKVVYYAQIPVDEDPETMAQERDLASTFVLIINLMATAKHPDREVLKEIYLFPPGGGW